MDPVGAPRLALRARLRVLDLTLVGLAFASMLLFIIDRTGRLAGAELRVLRYVDLGVVGLYAFLFIAKGTLADDPARWFRRHVWLVLGLLPLTIPLVKEPWFLVTQLVVLVVRGGKALDRAFDAHVMGGLTERYKARLAEEIAEPILMRLAVVLEESVTSKDYAAAIGERLDKRRDLVEAAVRRAIEASPKLSKVTRFGPVQRFVDETTKEVVDAAHAALTGPEMNELIREAWQDAFGQLKAGIQERKWERKGYGVKEIAEGVLHPRRGGAVTVPVQVAGVSAVVQQPNE